MKSLGGQLSPLLNDFAEIQLKKFLAAPYDICVAPGVGVSDHIPLAMGWVAVIYGLARDMGCQDWGRHDHRERAWYCDPPLASGGLAV